MTSATITFIDPPEAPVGPCISTTVIFHPAIPLPGKVHELRKQFSSHYGYTILLLEGLHSALVDLLIWYNVRQLDRKRKTVSTEQIEALGFREAIDSFSTILGSSERSPNGIVGRLHSARKLRNKLIHRVFAAETCVYFTTEGGVSKKIDELKAASDSVFSLAGIVQGICNAYAADCGVTAEVSEFASSLVGSQRTEFWDGFYEVPAGHRSKFFEFIQSKITGEPEAVRESLDDLFDVESDKQQEDQESS